MRSKAIILSVIAIAGLTAWILLESGWSRAKPRVPADDSPLAPFPRQLCPHISQLRFSRHLVQEPSASGLLNAYNMPCVSAHSESPTTVRRNLLLDRRMVFRLFEVRRADKSSG